MNEKTIIMDASVVRMNAKMVLEEGLFFAGFKDNTDTWCRSFEDAAPQPSVNEAINVARSFKLDKLPRIFTYDKQGNSIRITEIKY